MSDTEREPSLDVARRVVGVLVSEGLAAPDIFEYACQDKDIRQRFIDAGRAEAAAPAGPDLREWVESKVIPQDNPDYLTKYGHGWNDAMRAVAKKLALAGTEPGLDEAWRLVKPEGRDACPQCTITRAEEREGIESAAGKCRDPWHRPVKPEGDEG